MSCCLHDLEVIVTFSPPIGDGVCLSPLAVASGITAALERNKEPIVTAPLAARGGIGNDRRCPDRVDKRFRMIKRTDQLVQDGPRLLAQWLHELPPIIGCGVGWIMRKDF